MVEESRTGASQGINALAGAVAAVIARHMQGASSAKFAASAAKASPARFAASAAKFAASAAKASPGRFAASAAKGPSSSERLASEIASIIVAASPGLMTAMPIHAIDPLRLASGTMTRLQKLRSELAASPAVLADMLASQVARRLASPEILGSAPLLESFRRRAASAITRHPATEMPAEAVDASAAMSGAK